jgi:hypothetical protein
MHTTAYHEALKDDPAQLAAETTNPRAQWDENATVLFVWRDCHCGSTIAVTVAQEAAAADITRAGTNVDIVLAQTGRSLG